LLHSVFFLKNIVFACEIILVVLLHSSARRLTDASTSLHIFDDVSVDLIVLIVSLENLVALSPIFLQIKLQGVATLWRSISFNFSFLRFLLVKVNGNILVTFVFDALIVEQARLWKLSEKRSLFAQLLR
jgi:hypothetical protein